MFRNTLSFLCSKLDSENLVHFKHLSKYCGANALFQNIAYLHFQQIFLKYNSILVKFQKSITINHILIQYLYNYTQIAIINRPIISRHYFEIHRHIDYEDPHFAVTLLLWYAIQGLNCMGIFMQIEY